MPAPPPPQHPTPPRPALPLYCGYPEPKTLDILAHCSPPLVRGRRYGPFWIATTLIFVSAVTGNYASSLSYRHTHAAAASSDEKVWYYDIDKVRSAVFGRVYP